GLQPRFELIGWIRPERRLSCFSFTEKLDIFSPNRYKGHWKLNYPAIQPIWAGPNQPVGAAIRWKIAISKSRKALISLGTTRAGIAQLGKRHRFLAACVHPQQIRTRGPAGHCPTAEKKGRTNNGA